MIAANSGGKVFLTVIFEIPRKFEILVTPIDELDKTNIVHCSSSSIGSASPEILIMLLEAVGFAITLTPFSLVHSVPHQQHSVSK